MNKKIIFIGGTSRSGSTLLDLILANDPKAMSLGEIYAIFQPTRKHHFEELKKLKKDPIWSKIIGGGKRNLYPNLIKYFPNIDVFVDSSKDPFWFRSHEKVKNHNYDIKNVLIFKTPEELADSFIKRGKNKGWIKTYIRYHKKYFSLINYFYTISYKDLTQDDEMLKNLCERLGIEYFSEKMSYWNREQPTFFGSNSVRSQDALNAKKQLKKLTRKKITYEQPAKENLTIVQQAKNKYPQIESIKTALRNNSVIKNSMIPKKLKYSAVFLNIIYMKNIIFRIYRFFNPKDLFKV